MLRVLGCITSQHDLRLVVLAALICATACYTSFSLMARAGSLDAERRWPRRGWLIAAAFVTGSGVWATHFVAELAFRPGLPVAYDISLTALSVVIAILLSGVGIRVALAGGQYVPLGGAIVGVAVAAMHYTGMAALRVPARLEWDYGYVGASLVISVVVSALAMAVSTRRKGTGGQLLAASVLVLAIVGLHFTGMTAVRLLPDPSIAIPDQSIQPNLLAIAISAVTIMIIGLGLFGSIVDQHLAEHNARVADQLRRHVAEVEAAHHDLEKTAAQLREASQAKSLFLATMSHELRTPLNAIIGFSELLRNETFGPVSNERYRAYHEDIHDSGTHLLSLINDILDVCKLDAGQTAIRGEQVATTAFLRGCIDQVAPLAGQNGVALAFEPAADLPDIVVDPRRLRQIVNNLLSNAVKFTPRGGRVRMSAVDGAEGFDIVVEDTGIGMAEDDIPMALELFGQVDNSLARKYEGAGLGLPIARKLTELHGGTLTIKSAPNAGTTVKVSLPQSRICRRERAA